MQFDSTRVTVAKNNYLFFFFLEFVFRDKDFKIFFFPIFFQFIFYYRWPQGFTESVVFGSFLVEVVSSVLSRYHGI